MPARKLNTVQREAHLAVVASMLLRRQTTTDIAAELQVSKSQITYDKKSLRKQWQESAAQDVTEFVAMELASIEEQERETWNAWQESRGETIKTTQAVRDSGAGAVASAREQRVETSHSAGDPRFLSVLVTLRRQRMELLGLTGPDVQINLQANVNTPPPPATYDEWAAQNRTMETETGASLHTAPPETPSA